MRKETSLPIRLDATLHNRLIRVTETRAAYPATPRKPGARSPRSSSAR